MSDAGAGRSWRVPVAAAVTALLCVAAGVLVGWFGRAAGPEPHGTAIVLADSDIAFAQQMSVHHQQAVRMVEMLGSAVAPDVAAVAAQITTAQWREIGALTGWLELAGAPLQQPVPANAHSHDRGGMAGMPGMASDAELTRLYNAKGAEREVLFLQLMIRHHQGGIDMAAAAAHSTTVPAVRARAVSMINEQQQEIALMTVSLDRRGATLLPYP
ncbi:DUF305 domain-containing protein [Nocardia vaccinii]|uniref:DUF305 domain-containing protein n=1 Tax=Nocardia vaccinii TaxID=1822 RepID=UPI00082E13CE|nr:DUF305 domain-containing protein [Nocardia vaccinii]